jgi:2-phospho-L-lactate guanylyltransferase
MAEVVVEGGAPRFAGMLVEHLEQRPDQHVGRPRVVVPRAGDLGDEGVRRAELDARAHTVAVAPVAEVVGQALAQPALDPACRDEHELAGERIRQRGLEELGESIGEEVGPGGAVQDQRHADRDSTAPFRQARARQAQRYPDVMQGTVANYDPVSRSGDLLTDDGLRMRFAAETLAEHIRHLRLGQRVHVDADDQGVTGIRLW